MVTISIFAPAKKETISLLQYHLNDFIEHKLFLLLGHSMSPPRQTTDNEQEGPIEDHNKITDQSISGGAYAQQLHCLRMRISFGLMPSLIERMAIARLKCLWVFTISPGSSKFPSIEVRIPHRTPSTRSSMMKSV